MSSIIAPQADTRAASHGGIFFLFFLKPAEGRNWGSRVGGWHRGRGRGAEAPAGPERPAMHSAARSGSVAEAPGCCCRASYLASSTVVLWLLGSLCIDMLRGGSSAPALLPLGPSLRLAVWHV